MRRVQLFMVAALLTVAFSGCTTMKPSKYTPTKENLLANINPGDLIHIETHAGDKHQILVLSITNEVVRGEQLEIPFNQIKTVNTKQVSGLKTAGAIAGGYLVFALVVSLLFLGAIL